MTVGNRPRRQAFLRLLAPGLALAHARAPIAPAFVQQCDAERETLSLLRDWSAPIARPSDPG